MSFQTGLSGLNASSKSLDVIGNNIANANTVGFKTSRTEFAELVASSLGTSGNEKGAGMGTSVATVSQQFTQGSVNITGNSLDVAINGGGFFQLTRADGSTAFTRDGQFKLDKTGNIISNTGANVMGFPTDLSGVTTSITPQIMTVPTSAPIPASQTTTITAEFNLDARAKYASTTPVTPLSTYGTSLTTYDSQGVPLALSLYFSKQDTVAVHAAQAPVAPATGSALYIATTPTVPATTPVTPPTDLWAVYNTSVETPTPTPIGYMSFDSKGALKATFTAAGAATTNLGELSTTLTPVSPSSAGAFTSAIDVSNVTQFGTSFAVSNLSQDGYTAGDLTGINIEPSGVITTHYSNGQTQARGKVCLADFRNVQGLANIGGGDYLETSSSGQPVRGAPGLGRFGDLRSGAVEESNVDLTAELVNMMTSQRNYQANAQTIKTQDQIMATLANLR